MIAGMCVLGLWTSSDLGQLGLELLAILGKLLVNRRCVLNLPVARQDLLVDGHDIFFVRLDIVKCSLNIIWWKAKQTSNLIVAPSFLDVIHHVIE